MIAMKQKIANLELRHGGLLLLRDIALILTIFLPYIFYLLQLHHPLDINTFSKQIEIPKQIVNFFHNSSLERYNKLSLMPYSLEYTGIIGAVWLVMIFAAIFRRTYLFIILLCIIAVPTSLYNFSTSARFAEVSFIPLLIFMLRDREFLKEFSVIKRIGLAILINIFLVQISGLNFIRSFSETGDIVHAPIYNNNEENFKSGFLTDINSVPEIYSSQKYYVLAQSEFINGNYTGARFAVSKITNDDFAISDITKKRLKLLRSFAIDGKVRNMKAVPKDMTLHGYFLTFMAILILLISLLSMVMKGKISNIEKLHGQLLGIAGRTNG